MASASAPHLGVYGQSGEGFKMTPEGRKMLEPSCLKCPHMRICRIFSEQATFIFRTFPALPDGTPTAPYKAEEIAKICAYYESPVAGGIDR